MPVHDKFHHARPKVTKPNPAFAHRITPCCTMPEITRTGFKEPSRGGTAPSAEIINSCLNRPRLANPKLAIPNLAMFHRVESA